MNVAALLISTGFCEDHALILYVYLNTGSDESAEQSVLTVSLYVGCSERY